MVYLTDSRRHLICEPFSITNLHIMALDLEISKYWFHGGKFPHYGIPKRRIKEIEDKCQIITTRKLLTIIKENYDRIPR